jgi:hypothetical protein
MLIRPSLLLVLALSACSSEDDAPNQTKPDASPDVAEDIVQEVSQDATEETDAAEEVDATEAAECTPGELREDCVGLNGCEMTELCSPVGTWDGCFCASCRVEQSMTSCSWDGSEQYLIDWALTVTLTTESGVLDLGRVKQGKCDDGNGGFFVDSPENATLLTLCPSSCAAFEADPNATLSVFMTCPLL